MRTKKAGISPPARSIHKDGAVQPPMLPHPPMQLLFQPPLAWYSRASPMSIPDTPEALFEQLAEPTLRQLFPHYDAMRPRNQKLVRLLHTELTKGQLTDAAFSELVGLMLVLWRNFNHAALVANQERLDSEDEIDTDWVDAASSLTRLDQYLAGLLAALHALPEFPTPEDGSDLTNQYLFHGPGDP
jgi:hypothetical protein